MPSQVNPFGGCSTVVIECMPRDREVVGSNPTGCWDFPLFYTISASLILVPRGGETLLIFQ